MEHVKREGVTGTLDPVTPTSEAARDTSAKSTATLHADAHMCPLPLSAYQRWGLVIQKMGSKMPTQMEWRQLGSVYLAQLSV